MTVIWLVVWLCSGTPAVVFGGGWNSWAISLVVCAGVDLMGMWYPR